jgi:hypothetical protein
VIGTVMQDEDLVQLLFSAPRVLGFNVQRSYKPSVEVLQMAGFKGEELINAILISPALLCLKPKRYAEFWDVMQQHGIHEEVSSSFPHACTQNFLMPGFWLIPVAEISVCMHLSDIWRMCICG